MKWATMAIAVPLLALCGCALGGGEAPKPAPGAANGAAAVIRQLQEASAKGDWRTVCERLFTRSARERAGGKDCARLLRSDAAGIVRPRIRVVRITIRKAGASVKVRSTARGQSSLDDVIELRREKGAYRIDSLAG